MTEPQPAKPPRRKRYAGTHPRAFQDRYKELDPARFPAQVAKIRAQGRTPAGSHVSIMTAEILAALRPQPGDTVLDCTLGYGGHLQALAQAAAPGRLLAIDLDGEELKGTCARLREAGLDVHAHHTNFAGIGNVLSAEGLTGVDCLLADLGVSSMQLDRPERGFGFKHDGPLDMRMDRTRGHPVSKLLAEVDADTLAGWLRDYGDEPDAEGVAAAILREAPQTTRALSAVVLRAKGYAEGRLRRRRVQEQHPAARVFQALRMVVNREAANLDHLLRALPYVLNPDGRAAILTFHSGEKNRVRAAFAQAAQAGLLTPGLDGARPTREEVYGNPRARSARLFTAVRAA